MVRAACVRLSMSEGGTQLQLLESRDPSELAQVLQEDLRQDSVYASRTVVNASGDTEAFNAVSGGDRHGAVYSRDRFHSYHVGPNCNALAVFSSLLPSRFRPMAAGILARQALQALRARQSV
ncbi:hypothetical protein BHE74_00031592 [Ensete ventricosum]|nr:hypothetical protein GW17_00060524 [Ensete ventricosum]RWW61349.1 hypothetical protein BHE74_00031592 [Ensete ventricosum]